MFACVGGSFAACGIVAWHRRPDSRSGALMTATGFAFFLPALLGQIDSAARGDARDAARRPLERAVRGAAGVAALRRAARVDGRPAARVLVRAAAADPRVRLAAGGRGGGAEPAARLPRPGGRRRARHAPAVDPDRRLPRHRARARPALAGGDAAAAARAAADDRGLVRPAGLHRAADQRPRVGRALGAAAVDRLLLAGDGPARVPRGPAAVAAGAQRPRRPVPRPPQPRPRGAPGDARPGARRPRAPARLRRRRRVAAGRPTARARSRRSSATAAPSPRSSTTPRSTTIPSSSRRSRRRRRSRSRTSISRPSRRRGSPS